MRTLRKLLVVLVPAVVVLGMVRGFAGRLEQTAPVRALLAPFRAAALAAKPPDIAIAMPLPQVHVRQIANTWHGPRSGNRRHEGQDIFAARGTPVYSATPGIIVRVGHTGIGGNSVSVLGAGRRVYYYAHLSQFGDVRVGDPVTASTVLGYVGNTGNARTTPPHLHFGVYDAKGAINPLPLLVDRKLPALGARARPKETQRAFSSRSFRS